MSSIEFKGKRCPALLCALAGVIVSLTGCHSTEKELWQDCCFLFIAKDQSAASTGHKTIIGWQGVALFAGDGRAQLSVEGTPSEPSMKKRIKAEMAEFLAGHKDSQAADYFLGLGMSCTPSSVAMKNAATRCEIGLPPIWVKCYQRSNMFVPWDLPVPKELGRPISAFLGTSVEVSPDALLDVSTRIDPVPGGRLCQR